MSSLADEQPSPKKKNKTKEDSGRVVLKFLFELLLSALSPNIHGNGLCPTTPKSFEFNMLIDNSPPLSGIISPPLSILPSQIPSSRFYFVLVVFIFFMVL